MGRSGKSSTTTVVPYSVTKPGVARVGRRTLKKCLRTIIDWKPTSADGKSAVFGGSLGLGNFVPSTEYDQQFDQCRLMRLKAWLIGYSGIGTNNSDAANLMVAGAPDYDLTASSDFAAVLRKPDSKSYNLLQLRQGPLPLLDVKPRVIGTVQDQNGGSVLGELQPFGAWQDTSVDVAYQGYVGGWRATQPLTDVTNQPSFSLLVEGEWEFSGYQ